MKKVFSMVALAVIGASAYGQVTIQSLPNLVFQAGNKSAVKDVSYRYSLDEDNFLDVTSYAGVEFEKFYFFLGGNAANKQLSANESGIQGGFATKLGEAFYLGVYFNGALFNGAAEDYGKEKADDNTKSSKGTWNDELGILFASETFGGIRFDLLFNSTVFESKEYGKNAGTRNESSNTPFITTLQWGKKFGILVPKVAIGFQWPKHTVTELTNTSGVTGDTKEEKWENSELFLKLYSDISKFAVEYILTADFGTSQTGKIGSKNYKETKTGWLYNELNGYYNITANVNEKLQFKIRPQLQFRLYTKDNKTTYEYDNIQAGSKELNTAPYTGFEFNPIVQTGVRYQVNEKLSLYTGVQANILKVQVGAESAYKTSDTANETKDKPSKVEVTGLNLLAKGTDANGDPLLKLGGKFDFGPTLSLNASLESSLLEIGVPGRKGSVKVNNPFTTEGSLIDAATLVLSFKPAAASEE